MPPMVKSTVGIRKSKNPGGVAKTPSGFLLGRVPFQEYVHYWPGALQYIPVRLFRCWPIVFVLVTGCASLLDTGVSKDREVGQFDPLQNSLPDETTMLGLCGKDVVSAAYYLSDTQAAVSYTWQKFQVHAQGAATDGVTAAEKESAKLRHQAVYSAVQQYEEAIAAFRLTAAEVTGSTSAECEQKILLIVENIYQNYESTVNAVQTQATAILDNL